MANSAPQIEEVSASIKSGRERLRANPGNLEGIFFQSNMAQFPANQQKYKLVRRTGSGFKVRAQPGGAFTWVRAKYQALPARVPVKPDAYTRKVLSRYAGHPLGKPISPGRGHGCVDRRGIKLFKGINPNDIMQGLVGDCWFLSTVSALAAHRGFIRGLFRNTPRVNHRPLDGFNTYTVTLYDLPTWKPVNVAVDERLCTTQTGELLSAKPVDGELWVCYLEKAFAAHCGGWNEIQGGDSCHAFRVLTGCRRCFTIKASDGGYVCLGKQNPYNGQWAKLENSPKRSFQGFWPAPWPKVGGGSDGIMKLDRPQLFKRMCEWSKHFVMVAGTTGAGDKKDGVVDMHVYTVLECHENVKGTGNNLIKIRNPWHRGEYKNGMWVDGGKGWKEYPAVKAALQPNKADDGIFWMSRQEFFDHYKEIAVCCMSF